MEMPPVRYARTEDDVAIAYTVAGSGPVLLRPPGWVSHLERTWASGAAREQTEELAEYFTVVQYDKRGTGLSDRDVEDISLEAQLLDLEAVVAAIDSLRLAIFPGQVGGLRLCYSRRATRSALSASRSTAATRPVPRRGARSPTTCMR